MTKKDYEMIARIVAGERRASHTHPALSNGQRLAAVAAIDAVGHELAAALAVDNPRFDRARFLRACGVEV